MGNFFSYLLGAFWAEEMEIAILGLQNAGKSTFVNVLQTGNFDEDLLPTVGFRLQRVEKSNVNIKCWDLAGQSTFRSGMWTRYSRDCDCLVFVIDSSDPDSFDLSFEELSRLLGNPEIASIPLLLLFNKADLLQGTTDEKKEYVQSVLEQYSMQQHKSLLISCKEMLSIDTALEWLISNSKSNKAKAQK